MDVIIKWPVEDGINTNMQPGLPSHDTGGTGSARDQ